MATQTATAERFTHDRIVVCDELSTRMLGTDKPSCYELMFDKIAANLIGDKPAPVNTVGNCLAPHVVAAVKHSIDCHEISESAGRNCLAWLGMDVELSLEEEADTPLPIEFDPDQPPLFAA